MLINQAMGLVLPASTKFLIDQVIVKGRTDLLWKIALAAGAATVMQALTSFSLSQVLGVAAQRAITEMRKKVQAQIARLPVSYFDSTPGRQAHFADHERRRGHSQSGRHRPGAIGREFYHRGRRALCSVLAQLASDLDHNSGAGGFRRSVCLSPSRGSGPCSASAVR